MKCLRFENGIMDFEKSIIPNNNYFITEPIAERSTLTFTFGAISIKTVFLQGQLLLHELHHL